MLTAILLRAQALRLGLRFLNLIPGETPSKQAILDFVKKVTTDPVESA